jgi:hypothetical protein
VAIEHARGSRHPRGVAVRGLGLERRNWTHALPMSFPITVGQTPPHPVSSARVIAQAEPGVLNHRVSQYCGCNNFERSYGA